MTHIEFIKANFTILAETENAILFDADGEICCEINGSWFSENGLPMIVECSCCGMTMALPSAMIDDDGHCFCSSCSCEFDEPIDIDDDCGFDPYEGCYTYDC